MSLTNSRVCKPQSSSNPMFGAQQHSFIEPGYGLGCCIDTQHHVGCCYLNQYSLHYLRGTSGSIPRSIFAIRSWWLRIIFTTTMTPPITMAEMGIRNGPKPKTESKNGSRALLAASHDPNAIFLVELTLIEPVASWLQTRRSPS